MRRQFFNLLCPHPALDVPGHALLPAHLALEPALAGVAKGDGTAFPGLLLAPGQALGERLLSQSRATRRASSQVSLGRPVGTTRVRDILKGLSETGGRVE
jgi:hypothetical protein